MDQTIEFAPLNDLAPGQQVVWLLRARAVREGTIGTEVLLSSYFLHPPVPDVEPTRIIP